MRWFADLRVQHKMWVLLSISLAISLSVGLFALSKLDVILKDTEELGHNWLLKMQLLGDLRAYSLQFRRDLLAYMVYPTTDDEVRQYEQKMEYDKEMFETSLKSLEGLLETEDAKRLYSVVAEDWTAFRTVMDEVVSLSRQAKRTEAVQLAQQQAAPAGDKVSKSLEELLSLTKTQADNAVAQADSTGKDARLMTFLIIGGAAVFGILLIVSFSRAISVPVVQLAKIAEKASQGDLTEEVRVLSRDEIGTLGTAFDSMMLGLRTIVREITDLSESVASTSEELSAATQECSNAIQQVSDAIQHVAVGAQNQSDQAGQTVRAVQDVNEAIAQVAKGAESQVNSIHEASRVVAGMKESLDRTMGVLKVVAASSGRTAESAARGAELAKRVVASMQRVENATDNVAVKIRELGAHSQEIEQILEVIEGIAGQTNLLALNAAIEAARAGEHGRGFAVVADEVRKLAERSSTETKSIAELIGRVKEAIAKSVDAIESGSKDVEESTALTEEAGKALSQISSDARDSEKHISELVQSAEALAEASIRVEKAMDEIVSVAEENTAATEEIAASAGEMSKAIDGIAAVCEETSASAEEVSASAQQLNASMQQIAASAESLASVAENLRQLIARFRI